MVDRKHNTFDNCSNFFLASIEISLTKQLLCRIKLFYQYRAHIHVVCTFTWSGLQLFAIKCREWVLEWLRLLILSKGLTSQTWIRISLPTLNVNVSRFPPCHGWWLHRSVL